MLKTYTAKEIHQAFVLAFVNSLAERVKVIEEEEKEYSSSEKRTLESLGFTSSKKYTEISRTISRNETLKAIKKERIDFILFLDEVFRYFGHNTLLVSRKDFSDLIMKYDLVCGQPKDYLGEVPPEMYDELERAKKKYDEVISAIYADYYIHIPPYMRGCYYGSDVDSVINEKKQDFMDSYPQIYDMFYNIKFRPIIEVEAGFFSKRSKAVQNLVRFPFRLSNHSLPREISGHRVRYSSDDVNFFIAAPRKEMKTIAFVKEIALPKDPFVFSMTRYGALIYTSWGEEANDKVIQNYKDVYNRTLANVGVKDINELRKECNKRRMPSSLGWEL